MHATLHVRAPPVVAFVRTEDLGQYLIQRRIIALVWGGGGGYCLIQYQTKYVHRFQYGFTVLAFVCSIISLPYCYQPLVSKFCLVGLAKKDAENWKSGVFCSLAWVEVDLFIFILPCTKCKISLFFTIILDKINNRAFFTSNKANSTPFKRDKARKQSV